MMYSYPVKRPWRKKEHIYAEIGPPELPLRGYKDENHTDEEQGHEDGNTEDPMYSTWVWMGCRRIIDQLSEARTARWNRSNLKET